MTPICTVRHHARDAGLGLLHFGNNFRSRLAVRPAQLVREDPHAFGFRLVTIRQHSLALNVRFAFPAGKHRRSDTSSRATVRPDLSSNQLDHPGTMGAYPTDDAGFVSKG